MIDIHSHIIWGVDDGSASIDQSLEMLEMAAAAGTTDIVATPHANSEFPYDREVIAARLTQLQAHVGAKIRIHLGCDMHLSYQNIQKALAETAAYSINGGNYLLVEFPDGMVYPNTEAIFSAMLAKGLIPIITHPERNAYLQRNHRELSSWVGKGCLVQITGQSLLGAFGKDAKKAAVDLIQKGLVHFVASDAHDTVHRPPRLDLAYQWFVSAVGRERADALFTANPARVLAGQPLDWMPAAPHAPSERRRVLSLFR